MSITQCHCVDTPGVGVLGFHGKSASMDIEQLLKLAIEN